MNQLFLHLCIGFRNVLQHRRRSLLLGAALVAVTTLLVLLSGVTAGIRRTMTETATTLSTGHVNVGGFFKVTGGQSAPLVGDYRRVLDVVRRSTPELAFATARGRGWAKLIADRGSLQSALAGVDIADEPHFDESITLIQGKLSDLAQPNTLLVFEGQQKKLNVTVGDAVTISAQTSRGSANTVDVRVVAVAKDVGLLSRWTVFVPSGTVRQLFQIRDDVTGAIHVHLKPDAVAHAPAIADRLRGALTAAGFRLLAADPRAYWQKFPVVNGEDWVGQKLDVSTWEDELSYISWTLQLLQGLSGVLLAVALLIIAGGIANTMWIAVRERTREIGTLRAIGMSRLAVVRMVLIESLCLALLASALGGALAWALAFAVNAARIRVPVAAQMFLMSEHVHVVVEPSALFLAAVVVTAVASFASIWPALQAARLRPATAMAHFE